MLPQAIAVATAVAAQRVGSCGDERDADDGADDGAGDPGPAGRG